MRPQLETTTSFCINATCLSLSVLGTACASWTASDPTVTIGWSGGSTTAVRRRCTTTSRETMCLPIEFIGRDGLAHTSRKLNSSILERILQLDSHEWDRPQRRRNAGDRFHRNRTQNSRDQLRIGCQANSCPLNDSTALFEQQLVVLRALTDTAHK